LLAVLRAAIDEVDAGRLVRRAVDARAVGDLVRRAAAVDVLAAGKAAAAMLPAFLDVAGRPIRTTLGVGPGRPHGLPAATEWHPAGHPLPNDGSVAGARRALAVAASAGADDLLVVLLSGGGSALMALPAGSLTLADKQQTVAHLLTHGADIHELNTVRKHLSAIKGGQLAAAATGRVLTLAISDVVGDDPSVIASGPTVADDSTYAQALAVLERRGGPGIYPPPVVARLRAGVEGRLPETPASGDARLARSTVHLIGRQRGAIEGASQAAAARGYDVLVVEAPTTGEARDAGRAHIADVARRVAQMGRPACVIAAGETTVTVTGRGIGGRNQEFSFAMAQAMADLRFDAVGASVGTDGIDGPTDAAGAVVDRDTFSRARDAGIGDPLQYLHDNDTYTFFSRTGDLIRTGPTSTNVGDLQVVLVG
jgi:hydroxypyruvate reductase